jgi:hypothetical protein
MDKQIYFDADNIPSLKPEEEHKFSRHGSSSFFKIEFEDGIEVFCDHNKLSLFFDDGIPSFSAEFMDLVRTKTPISSEYVGVRDSWHHDPEQFNERIAPLSPPYSDGIYPQFFEETARRGLYYLSPEVMQLAERHAKDNNLSIPDNSIDLRDRDTFLINHLIEMEKDTQLKAQIVATMREGIEDFATKLLSYTNSVDIIKERDFGDTTMSWRGGVTSFARQLRDSNGVKIPSFKETLAREPRPSVTQNIQFMIPLSGAKAKQAFEEERAIAAQVKTQQALEQATRGIIAEIAKDFSEKVRISSTEEAIQPLGICYGKEDFWKKNTSPIVSIVYADPRMPDVHESKQEAVFEQATGRNLERLGEQGLPILQQKNVIYIQATQELEDNMGIRQFAEHIGGADKETIEALERKLVNAGIEIRESVQLNLFGLIREGNSLSR